MGQSAVKSRLVSIALCTYNGETYLAEQLDTLVTQTYPYCEIIIVDDCSKDNTVEIVTRYANKYPQIKLYVNNENLGYTKNFEKAISLCSGELIALCDQDDIWAPQKIELQVDEIKDNILIYHDSEFVSQDGKPLNKKMSDLMNLYRGDQPGAFLLFNCVSGHSILMKKELIEYAFPLTQGYFHDWWLAYVATNVGKIDFVPQCLVKYRQHNKSETNILQLERSKDNYKFSSAQHLERTLKWVSYCASFRGNKDPALIKKFYESYKKRLDSYISFDLGLLLLKHWEAIFFMRKKPTLSKLNYVRKQFIGLKFKKLFS